MNVDVKVWSMSLTGALTLVEAWEASLFHIGQVVHVNGVTATQVIDRNVSTGVVSINPMPPRPVTYVSVDSLWHPQVVRAIQRDDQGYMLHERVCEAAIHAVENGQRIRRVSAAMSPFALMTRQLGARIEFDERADVSWVDLMTACGPVRVFANGKLRGDEASLEVDERHELYTYARSRQTDEQLRRRAELETEDAENWMARVEESRTELTKRAL